MQIRDLAKQSAVASSDTAYALDGGTAATGYRTFQDAFTVPVLADVAGVVDYHNVAVKVEAAGGAWQVVNCTLRRANATPNSLSLVDGVVMSSSAANAPLGLAASTAVTVTVVASESSFGLLALRARGAYADTQGGMDVAGSNVVHPNVGTLGLFAVGMKSQASGTEALAMGHHAFAGEKYSAVLGGYGATSNIPGEVITGGVRMVPVGGIQTYATRGNGVLNAYTTDATPGLMALTTPDGLLVSGSGAPYMDAGVTVMEGFISAVDKGNGDTKVWKFSIVWGTTTDYATTSVLAQTFTELYEAAGATAWVASASADSASNSGSINITGEAARNITWAGSYLTHYHGVWV